MKRVWQVLAVLGILALIVVLWLNVAAVMGWM